MVDTIQSIVSNVNYQPKYQFQWIEVIWEIDDSIEYEEKEMQQADIYDDSVRTKKKKTEDETTMTEKNLKQLEKENAQSGSENSEVDT